MVAFEKELGFGEVERARGEGALLEGPAAEFEGHGGH